MASISTANSYLSYSSRIDKVLRSVHECIADKGHQSALFAAFALTRMKHFSNYTTPAQPKEGYAPNCVIEAMSSHPDYEDAYDYFLARRTKPSNVRALLADDPSYFAKDKIMIALLCRVPEEHLPALLDYGLFFFSQYGDVPSCRSLLRLGANPNRPLPELGQFERGAEVAYYPPSPTHPLSSIAHSIGRGVAQRQFSEPRSQVKQIEIYLALGGDPNGILAPLRAGTAKSLGGKRLATPIKTPLSEAFTWGLANTLKILKEAGGDPFATDIQGLIPIKVPLDGAVPPYQRTVFSAYLSEIEKEHLIKVTERPLSDPEVSTSVPTRSSFRI